MTTEKTTMTAGKTITLELSFLDTTDLLAALCANAENAKKSRDTTDNSDAAEHDQAIIDRSARLVERVLELVASEVGHAESINLAHTADYLWNETVGELPSYAQDTQDTEEVPVTA